MMCITEKLKISKRRRLVSLIQYQVISSHKIVGIQVQIYWFITDLKFGLNVTTNLDSALKSYISISGFS